MIAVSRRSSKLFPLQGRQERPKVLPRQPGHRLHRHRRPLHRLHLGAFDLALLDEELEELLQGPEPVGRGRRLRAGVELVHERLDVLPPDRCHLRRHAVALEERRQLVDPLPVRLDGPGRTAGRPLRPFEVSLQHLDVA
jgi:hypothetical protein